MKATLKGKEHYLLLLSIPFWILLLFIIPNTETCITLAECTVQDFRREIIPISGLAITILLFSHLQHKSEIKR